MEWPKNTKIRRPKVAAAAAFADPIWAHLTAAGREILPAWSSGDGAPPWPAHVQGWWPVTPPTAKPVWSTNGSKRPSSVFKVLGSFLFGFGAQNECVGARVLFGMQNYVYIGPRVAFR